MVSIAQTTILSFATCSRQRVLWPLDDVNRLSIEQMPYLWGREKNAVASSNITKAPSVLCLNQKRVIFQG